MAEQIASAKDEGEDMKSWNFDSEPLGMCWDSMGKPESWAASTKAPHEWGILSPFRLVTSNWL